MKDEITFELIKNYIIIKIFKILVLKYIYKWFDDIGE